MGAEVMILL
jgi:starch synthase